MDASTPARSPFIPGSKLQFAWDSTSIGYLKTCPRLYQYIMVDGWSGRGESIHLRFGQEFHSALQDYDLSRAAGINHNDAVHDTIRALLERTWDAENGKPWTVDKDTKAGKYKNRHSLVRLVIDCLDHYEDDVAKTYILQDGRPAVELSFRFELDWGPDNETLYMLCGHLDRVVDYLGSLYVMDHKTTTTTLSPHYFNQYAPNNQMSLYTLASQLVLDTPMKGVIINGAQLLVDDDRLVRGITYRTPDQLDEWLVDLRVFLAQAEAYAAADYWPQNDTACDKFGGCRFREVCSKSPQVREKFLKSDFVKLGEEEKWNPLRSR